MIGDVALRRAPRRALVLALLLPLAACGKKQLPTADEPQRAVPNLAGLNVMVLPAQPGPRGVPAGLDEAIAGNLSELSPSVHWVFPPALQRAVQRAPWLEIRPDALPVSTFRKPDLEFVPDPLYGQLRRLGAVVDARYAVLPVAASYIEADEPGQQGRIEVAAAIVDTVGGRVLWYGVVAGERGPDGDEVVLGTAANAVARMVAPRG